MAERRPRDGSAIFILFSGHTEMFIRQPVVILVVVVVVVVAMRGRGSVGGLGLHVK